MHTRCLGKHFKLFECAIAWFGEKLEVISARDAYRLGHGAHTGHGPHRARPQCISSTSTAHTQSATHWVLRLAHTDKGLETVPNSLKSFVKPIKSIGMLYNINDSSNYVNQCFLKLCKCYCDLWQCLECNKNS